MCTCTPQHWHSGMHTTCCSSGPATPPRLGFTNGGCAAGFPPFPRCAACISLCDMILHQGSCVFGRGKSCVCASLVHKASSEGRRDRLPPQASLFGFGAAPQVDTIIHAIEGRKPRKMDLRGGGSVAFPVFTSKEPIRGRVTVTVPDGKKMEHLGIKVELKGIIGASR